MSAQEEQILQVRRSAIKKVKMKKLVKNGQKFELSPSSDYGSALYNVNSNQECQFESNVNLDRECQFGSNINLIKVPEHITVTLELLKVMRDAIHNMILCKI